MSNTKQDDIDYIFDEINKAKSKKSHKRKLATKKRPIKVRSSVEVARDTYRTTKSVHNKAIHQAYRAYRNTRKQHLVLKAQAKNVYKLAKLQEKAGL